MSVLCVVCEVVLTVQVTPWAGRQRTVTFPPYTQDELKRQLRQGGGRRRHEPEHRRSAPAPAADGSDHSAAAGSSAV